MSKQQIPNILKKRIGNANARGTGYVLPESYNNIWSMELQKLIDKDVAKEIKAKGKKKGFWLGK
jgi:hypothetical protein